MRKLPLSIAAASFVIVASMAKTSRAEVTLSAEPQVGLVSAGSTAALIGGAGRVGFAIDSLYPILVAPELSLEGHALVGDATIGDFRAVGGGRVGILASVEPSLYVHAGYGGAGVGVDGWTSMFTLDAGAAIDFRLERWVTLGVSLGYLGFFSDAPVHGAVLGPHATFWL